MKRIIFFILTVPPLLTLSFTLPANASGDHPSFGVTAASLPDIGDRITSDSTIQGWMNSVRSTAASYYDDTWSQCSDVGSEYLISHRAMTLAFVWQVDGTEGYAQKAAEYLQCAMVDPADRDEFGWHWGGTLLRYGFAYDWVEPGLSGAQDTQIRGKLLDALTTTLEIFERPPTTGSVPIKYYINVRLRIGGGLGVLAMALRDHGDAAACLDYVVEDLFGEHPGEGTVPYYINIVVTPDGTYNEGDSYQDDSFGAFLPFLLAYEDLTGIDLTGDYGTPGEGIWSDARIREMYYGNLCRMTPERLRPTTDTGWRAAVNDHELVIPLFDEPRSSELQWLWDEEVRSSREKVYSVIWGGSPSSITGTEPSWTSCRNSDYAVLRSGWAEDDIFVLVESEHEPVRSTHCNPDQTSFLMFARGQYLLINPGDGRNYGSPAEGHTWLRYNPAAHNIVIIDHREQPDYDAGEGTPARLYSNTEARDPVDQRAWFMSDLLDLVTVRLTYYNVPDVTLTRTVAMVKDRYVVVGDDLAAGSSHAYEALLHYGGPAGDEAIPGTLTVDGGHITWQTTGIDDTALLLDAKYFPAPDAVTEHDDGYTNYESGQTYSHHYTRAAYSGSDARFASFIDVADTGAGESVPASAGLAAVSGTAVEIESAEGRDIWFFADAPGAAVQVTGEGIEADTSFAVLQLGGSGAIVQLAAVDCSSISKNAAVLVAADHALSIRLEPFDDMARGEAWADVETAVNIHVRFTPESVGVDGSPVDFDWDGGTGVVTFTLPAGGSAFAILSETAMEEVSEVVEDMLEEGAMESVEGAEPEDTAEPPPDGSVDVIGEADAAPDAATDMESESPTTEGGCSCRVFH